VAARANNGVSEKTVAAKTRTVMAAKTSQKRMAAKTARHCQQQQYPQPTATAAKT